MNQPVILNNPVTRKLNILLVSAMAILLFVGIGNAQTTTFLQQAKLLASDGAAQDSHGFSVAISGDTAVVGAPRNSGGTNLQSRGSAYVYVRNSAGAWTQQQKLAPSDGAATDQFGYSVAINGNTIAVGRYNTTTGLNRGDGKVYIFTRAGTVWTETQTLQSSDIAQGDLFGNSLAFENDTLVVGALNKNNGNNFFQGAAYVFNRTGAGANFTQQAKLTASDGVFADFFGYSLAISGDSIIVGATSLAGQPNSKGKAYIFTRSGASWTQQAILQASDGTNGDAFGYAVGISGDTAVVGARLDDVGAVGDQGSVYVFNRVGATWTQTQQLFGVETTQRNDTFGSSVAIKGDTIAIGAPTHEFVGLIANHGAVYVFSRTGGGNFTRRQKLVHDDPAPDGLGTSLAFDGTSIISGAPSKDSARGAAYVFAAINTDSQKILSADGKAADEFGNSISISGDTAVVGAYLGEEGAASNSGVAYVFVRDSSGNWTQQAKLTASDAAAGDRFGTSVGISGETIVVGADGDDIGANGNQGSVYVFTRNGTTWTFQQKLLASDGANSSQLGVSVAVEGDTIVAGASFDTVNGKFAQGSAYVFTRSGATWTQQQKIFAADGSPSDNFGGAVALSGNTTIVGAVNDSPTFGSAYVFTRSGTTWTQQQRLFADNQGSQFNYGISVALHGDMAIVGAEQGGNFGSAYFYTRENGVWTERQILLPASGAALSARFGFSVAMTNDTAVIGAYQDFGSNNQLFGRGAAYVFRRSGAIWTQTRRLIAFDGAQFDRFGDSVAVSGNTAFVGARLDDVEGKQDQGSVYAFNIASKNSFGDFDGDGKADLSVFRPSNGVWYLQNSTAGFSGTQFGAASDRIVPADYDGDGKTDIAVYRSGVWYLQRSIQGFTGINFGAAEDLPVPADYDGDGKADIAVFRPSNGTWYRINSSNNQQFAVQFGANGDRPTLGDFDGDGKADVAVYRPSNGGWYRINSSNNQLASLQFGTAEDVVVPADYDGDGKTDVAVFRPSSGTWYLQRSQLGFTGIAFGFATDKPVPADYDGDGKADIAVYRAGVWYIQRSTQGFTGVSFGAADDIAAPNAFIR